MTAQHCDHVADAIALVESIRRDDLLGTGAILRNMDPGPVAAVLGKLLAELADENAGGRGICAGAGCFRAFAAEAIQRP